MKNKIKLHAIGNDKDFNFYIFDKKDEIYHSLSKILNKVFGFYLEELDENTKRINIETYKDVHGGAPMNSGQNSRLDIFYGDKKMFFAIHCSQKLRIKFNGELFKIAKMPKPKPIKIKKNKK